LKKINKTSMQDIADYVGVSKNCVSLALNGKRGVSELVRERIIQAAHDLNYAGRGEIIRKKMPKSIIVLAPEYVMMDRIFYPQFISDIGKECRLHGYNAIFTDISSNMEIELILPDILLEVDHLGIIVVGVLSKSYVRHLNDTLFSVVLVDNYHHDSYCNVVVTENIQGAYAAVQHLMEKGHKEIGFIGPINATSSNYERWIGYSKALSDNKLRVYHEYCLTESLYLSCSNTEIDEFITSLSSYPTAWFCSNDSMAISLIQSLNRKEIEVPKDVSGLEFDDIELAEIVIPSLSTIRVKIDVIARQAVSLLLSLWATDDEQPNKKISVYGELVCRDSVKDITIDNSVAIQQI